LAQGVGRRGEPPRSALDERFRLGGRPVPDRQREAGVQDPLGDRLAHVAEPDYPYCSIHPPATPRLTPSTPPFSSRNIAAPTISSVVPVRPIGVRACTASTALSLPDHSGVSPMIPGWIAFTRTGASCTASVRTRPSTPPFTVEMVVEPE